jgi:hypothetical protein
MKFTSTFCRSSVFPTLFCIIVSVELGVVTIWYQEPSILSESLPPSLDLGLSRCVGANPCKTYFDLFLEPIGTSVCTLYQGNRVAKQVFA